MRRRLMLARALTERDMWKLLDSADTWMKESLATKECSVCEAWSIEAKARTAMYVWLALTTGARLSEICRLKWDDADLGSGVAHVWRHKGYSSATWEKGSPYSGGWVDEVTWVRALVERLCVYRQIRSRLAAVAGIDPDVGTYILRSARTAPRRHTDEFHRVRALSRLLQNDFPSLLKFAGLPYMRLHDLRHTFGKAIAKASGGNVFTVRDAFGHSNTNTAQLYVDADRDAVTRSIQSVFDGGAWNAA